MGKIFSSWLYLDTQENLRLTSTTRVVINTFVERLGEALRPPRQGTATRPGGIRGDAAGVRGGISRDLRAARVYHPAHPEGGVRPDSFCKYGELA